MHRKERESAGRGRQQQIVSRPGGQQYRRESVDGERSQLQHVGWDGLLEQHLQATRAIFQVAKNFEHPVARCDEQRSLPVPDGSGSALGGWCTQDSPQEHDVRLGALCKTRVRHITETLHPL